MKRGKYEKVVPVTRKKRGLNTRIVTLMLALTLLVGVAVGGTIAWLTDKTDAVENTFTVGNIDITLTESDTNPDVVDEQHEYKMVPGNTVAKDPKVAVTAGSEACWLFVKVVESDNLDDFITYAIAGGWTALDGVDGVYYREVNATDAAASVTYSVLANDQVTVKDTVTKEMMDDIEAGTADEPTLTFTAYAVQSANIATAADAWAKVNP